MQMDRAALLAVCKQHRLYQTPHLNHTLYCNFQGFGSIAGLEPYTGLKALFLEGNALETTAGLPSLPELKCLFLQQNLLRALGPELAAQQQLSTLNISGNQLADLSDLAGCTQLQTLICTDNQLESMAAVAPLAQCTALESLDLQNNRLGDDAVLQVFAQLPKLKCLYLKGNPLVSSMRSYRKSVIAAIPTLTYLDDRPIFEVERLCAEAWAQGGLEAEREARAAYHERKLERERQQVESLRQIREAGWKKQREALGMEGSGDPCLEGVSDDLQLDLEEPEELREARRRLETFTAAAAHQGQEQEQLPGLVEADVQAVLEESKANEAVLCSSSPDAVSSFTTVKEENSCPNHAPAQAPAGEARAAAAEVPQAEVTIWLGSCTASLTNTGTAGAKPAAADTEASAAGQRPACCIAGSSQGATGEYQAAASGSEVDSRDAADTQDGDSESMASETCTDCLDELD